MTLRQINSTSTFLDGRISSPYAVSRKAHIAPTGKQLYLIVFIDFNNDMKIYCSEYAL